MTRSVLVAGNRPRKSAITNSTEAGVLHQVHDGLCDDCGASIQLEDYTEFCVKLSPNQDESLDCNLYRCEACIPSGAEDEQSYPKKRKATVLKLQSSSDDDGDAAMDTDLVMVGHRPCRKQTPSCEPKPHQEKPTQG